MNNRLETAVSTILVQVAYTQLRPIGAEALTISIFIFYGSVQAALMLAAGGFWQKLLLRCKVVLIGLLGNVFLEGLQISSGVGARSSLRLLLPKLAAVGAVLVFLGIALRPVQGQYNLVGICLFVFSDSLQGQLEAVQDGLVVPVVAAVVCTASPLLAKALDARLPGLSVLSQALFMATVNVLLDLIADNSATPSAHSAMLLLFTVVLEVCKGVDPALQDTQAYAIYRVTAVVAAHLRRLRVEPGVVAVCGALALLITRKLVTRWALAGLAAQILLLLLVSGIVSEFKMVIAPLPAANKGVALAALLVSFEAAKFASDGA
jgi:hypothetical protein